MLNSWTIGFVIFNDFLNCVEFKGIAIFSCGWEFEHQGYEWKWLLYSGSDNFELDMILIILRGYVWKKS